MEAIRTAYKILWRVIVIKRKDSRGHDLTLKGLRNTIPDGEENIHKSARCAPGEAYETHFDCFTYWGGRAWYCLCGWLGTGNSPNQWDRPRPKWRCTSRCRSEERRVGKECRSRWSP